MPTNLYYNNYPANQITQEQLLVEDLVIEAMQIYGMDVFYLPRESRDQVDYIFGEDTLKTFTKAYPIEMYLEDVLGMEGEGDIISKFGLEIRDEMTFLVSRRRFKYATASSNLIRPREGDLLYIPLIQNFFEITFVEHENNQAMFYTLGRGRQGNVYVYALKLKQFVFSEEIISTGIDEIDEQIRDSYKRTEIILNTGSGNYTEDEIVYQSPNNLANATARALVYSWQANTKKLEIYLTQGEFANTSNVIGNTSGAIWVSSVVDDFVNDNTAFEDIVDNKRIQDEADAIIDFTERNPFGEV
jgi:hypothetical protein